MGSLGMGGDFDLPEAYKLIYRFDFLFFQAHLDDLFDVFQRLIYGFAIAATPLKRGTTYNIVSIFIYFDDDRKMYCLHFIAPVVYIMNRFKKNVNF